MPKGNSRRMHDSDDDIESVTPNRESKGRGKRRIKKSKVNIDWNVDGVAGFSKNPANLKVQEPVELEEGSDKAKDHSQKRAELAEGWNSVVSNISNDFTDLLAAGTPQQEAISPFIPSKEFNCSCEVKDLTKVVCVFLCKTVKECNFHFCKDIEPASVLLRHHLFPGSPKEPRIAFHLELLRAFEILRSISFISYEGFADFVSAFQRERATASMHRNFADAFNAYMKIKLITEARVRDDYNLPSDKCLACPNTAVIDSSEDNSERPIYCMDGNFGLKRTARGQHSSITADSTIMTKFFAADSKVEQYADNVARSASNRTQETNDDDNDEERRVECSALKNADPKRTATANAKFHETGVFGSLCARHGVPLSFVNIVKSGEKYKYPLAVVHEIFDQLGTKNVDIMYDIGCQFEASLKRNFEDWSGRCAVGIFHAYAHKPSCQVEYNPKYISGFGMTDGEWSERLWSYMNGYIPTTRHMSSEHRILTLTIALDYFKRKRINSIGQTLVNRYKSAEKKQASTKKYMEDNRLSYAALQRKWEFHKHEILHGSLDPRMAEDTEKEEIIQRLHAACTGRWLIFDRLYNNKEALNHAMTQRMHLSIRKSKDQIETIMDELNDLLVSRSNAPPGTRLVTFHMIDRTDSEFWRDRNYFKGLQEYHDHRRSEEEISMLKREAERVRDGCQQYLSALNSAITVANSRNREGDMLYLSRWYNQVLSWTTETISQLEYIPKSRERQAPAQTQDPDTIAIPIPDQQATAVILPIQDDTLYGEEETVQTVEDLVAIEDDDTINGYY